MSWRQGEQNSTAYWSASGMMKSGLNTGELPHFTSKAALTRELYDMIVEFRTTCHFGQLKEGLKQNVILTQRLPNILHLWRGLLELYRSSLEIPHLLDAVLQMNASVTMTKIEPNSVEDKINPSMSAQLIRAAYEDFITRQRIDENMTYSRTLAGKILALDATVKVVNKASAHSLKNPASGVKSVVNPFAGGLLTDVNEDKELFLVSNASFEIQAPVSEYAMRCEKPGIDFANEGGIVVDRCCDYRRANHVDPIRQLSTSRCALWPYH
ncbi:hypothetical protein J010_00791 [Cryptococcus neoformans]|nr:hypothetical protein C355_00811 [Cryptococcus neoformans var. grubii Th84]OXH18090.1 hypothetical protein J010_00791 [Cryptococcus neoformans var. grubii]OXH37922.1 hypothetical protein J009_00812 [Cryptococcus neoformans var. grubii]OXH58634.1 hypothetical protein J003_00815 [Cryptococcus neoformans var. grubii]OXH59103.1 hypothetical protein J004_00847 [Cryptococcus neoformans var. grubii]